MNLKISNRVTLIVCALATLAFLAGWLYTERPRALHELHRPAPVPHEAGDMELESPRRDLRIRLADLPAVRLVLVLSPSDCPSCYHIALAELNRLCLEEGWEGRIMCSLLGDRDDCERFLTLMHRRYRLLFPVWYLAGSWAAHLRAQTTPLVFLLDDSLRVHWAVSVTPASALGFSALVDSLGNRPQPAAVR